MKLNNAKVRVSTKAKVKREDKVEVIAGKQKGKIAKVLQVNVLDRQVLVEGVNVVKRHTKPSMFNPEGGIVEKTLPIDISNVMVYCEKCKRGVRVGYEGEGRDKKRVCKRCHSDI